MVNTADLKSAGASLTGSSPVSGTILGALCLVIRVITVSVVGISLIRLRPVKMLKQPFTLKNTVKPT